MAEKQKRIEKTREGVPIWDGDAGKHQEFEGERFAVGAIHSDAQALLVRPQAPQRADGHGPQIHCGQASRMALLQWRRAAASEVPEVKLGLSSDA